MNEQTEQKKTLVEQLQIEALIDGVAPLEAGFINPKERTGALLSPSSSLGTRFVAGSCSSTTLTTTPTRRKTIKKLGLLLLGGAATATALGAIPGPAQARVIASRQSPVGLYAAPPGSQDPGGTPPAGRVYGLVTTNQLTGLNYNVLPDDNVAIVALCGTGTAINAHSNDAYAINASSSTGIAVSASTGSGLSTPADALLFAVRGWGNGNSGGIQGNSTSGSGVSGTSDSGAGCRGDSRLGAGLYGSSSESFGVYAQSTNSYAGWFTGNLHATGTVSGATKSFKIDHPLDPANKYLFHTSVESPDMKNIYDGVVTLDEQGEATVIMPDWFDALNTDFRYQLSCLGQFAPVFVAKELNSGAFKIAGGVPGQKISWQVTGIRQDEWAKVYRTPVELEKIGPEKGAYIHPELYGQPEEKALHHLKRPV